MSAAARLLIFLVALLLAAWCGYHHGAAVTNDHWRVQQLEALHLADAEQARNEDLAQRAREQAQTAKTEQEKRYAALEKRYQQLRQAHPLPRVELDGAAVWMWNSALAGHPDVPVRACGTNGSAGAADAACAQGTGLDLDDVFANHEDNAHRCARNFARYQRLIDYLRQIEREK